MCLLSNFVFAQELKIINNNSIEYIGIVQENGDTKILTKKKLLKLYKKDSLFADKLNVLLGYENLGSCIKAIKSKKISKDQIILCKQFKEVLTPANLTINLSKDVCGLVEEPSSNTKSANLKSNNNKLSDEINELFRSYDCSCSDKPLACKDNVYYCGNLYNPLLIHKDYTELLELEMIDEIIGKSVESPWHFSLDGSGTEDANEKKIKLRDSPCFLNKLADKLPNDDIQKIFDYSLGLKAESYRPVPSYKSYGSKCQISPQKYFYIKSLLENKEIEKIQKEELRNHYKERKIARLLNNITDCDNNYAGALLDRIEREREA